MIIHKFVVHVLDKNSDVPVLADFEGRIYQEVDIFFQKIIKKVLKDDDIRKATFRNYNENIVKECCEQMIYDDSTFLENSKEIAAYLFDVMSTNAGMNSCDIAICLYSDEEEKYVAILKLDYKKLYTHTIELAEDKFNIQIQPHEIGIPEAQKPRQCAIIGINSINDEYHLRVLDKDSEKEDVESSFINEFLDCEKIIDDNYKTKIFKTSADNWITNALGTNIKKAEDARSMLNYMLKEKEDIQVHEFIENALDEDDLKSSFKEFIEEKGVEEGFSVDKVWIEKKLKKRNIRTDNGFDIKANLVDFEDPMKYSVTQNKDGSVNIQIKNIKYIEER